MSNVNISIQERTENFAIRVVKTYSELNKRDFDDAGKVLSKQFWEAEPQSVQTVQKLNMHNQPKILSINIL